MTDLIVKYKRTRYERFWKIKQISELGLSNLISDLYSKTDVNELILHIRRKIFALAKGDEQ